MQVEARGVNFTEVDQRAGGYGSGLPPFDTRELQQRGSPRQTRPFLPDYTATRAELLERATDVFRWIASGELKLRGERTYPLAEAAAAHRALAGRGTAGKLVLLP